VPREVIVLSVGMSVDRQVLLFCQQALSNKSRSEGLPDCAPYAFLALQGIIASIVLSMCQGLLQLIRTAHTPCSPGPVVPNHVRQQRRNSATGQDQRGRQSRRMVY
jgi:hypothetical protein